MKEAHKRSTVGTRERLSLLWMVIMFTMAFADILTFVLPESLNSMVQGTTDVKITQGLLLIMAILVQIPILMIYLSRVLTWKINRVINIAASIITILFVVGGGSLYLHYLFFGSIEVLCMVLIIVYSVKWKQDEWD